ncbi:hypothetical protein M3J09_011195 [Ascochyta lentis]
MFGNVAIVDTLRFPTEATLAHRVAMAAVEIVTSQKCKSDDQIVLRGLSEVYLILIRKHTGDWPANKNLQDHPNIVHQWWTRASSATYGFVLTVPGRVACHKTAVSSCTVLSDLGKQY